jgi:hypothetical protein
MGDIVPSSGEEYLRMVRCVLHPQCLFRMAATHAGVVYGIRFMARSLQTR